MPRIQRRVETKAATKTEAKSASREAATDLRWHWPAHGKVVSNYSARVGDNRGLNIAGARGDRILAAAAGTVVYAGDGLPRYGNLLIIKHNDTYLSAYAHCSRLAVAEGQTVLGGEQIAAMGKSGAARVMLHFEIRKHGKPVDPRHLLPTG